MIRMIAAACAASILLAGCNRGAYEEPEVRLDAAPREAYEIVLALDDAHPPFGHAESTATYRVDNPACRPRDRRVGAPVAPLYRVPLEVVQRDSSTYAVVVALDALQDEDYWGRGVCVWRLESVGISLQATGAAGETQLSARLLEADVRLGAIERSYFWSGHYPRERVADFIDGGYRDLDQMPRERRSSAFSASIAAHPVGR